MLLESRDGTVLELHLVGYEFPDEQNDPWDANQLRVVVRVVAPSGSWETEDPCLSTTEVAELAAWLERWAFGHGTRTALDEPNLSFTVTGVGPSALTLQVRVALEHPLPSGDPTLEMEVERRQLRTAAADLRSELEQFPTRAQPPL